MVAPFYSVHTLLEKKLHRASALKIITTSLQKDNNDNGMFTLKQLMVSKLYWYCLRRARKKSHEINHLHKQQTHKTCLFHPLPTANKQHV